MSTRTCNECDVICGRGRSTFLHAGNKHFRMLVEHHMEQYSKATSRTEKSAVVSNIIDTVRGKGDFVRQLPNGTWIKVTDRMAREKCGQGLRDFLHSKYRSSTQSKQARRKVDLDEESTKMTELLQANVAIRSLFTELKEDLKDQSLADDAVQVMFDTANSRILEELKASRIAYPPSPDVTSTPPSTSSSTEGLPHLSLLRKVTEEDNDDSSSLSPATTSFADRCFMNRVSITSFGDSSLSGFSALTRMLSC